MFVVVTVLAISCAWAVVQVKWIKARTEAREWINEHGVWGYNLWRLPLSAPMRPKLIENSPWSIRLFGEFAVEEIYLDPGLIPPHEMPEIASEMARLFPEAKIIATRHAAADSATQ